MILECHGRGPGDEEKSLITTISPDSLTNHVSLRVVDCQETIKQLQSDPESLMTSLQNIESVVSLFTVDTKCNRYSRSEQSEGGEDSLQRTQTTS